MALTDPTPFDLGAGVAVERSLATTGRCLCGRRPTLRQRLGEVIYRVSRRLTP